MYCCFESRAAPGVPRLMEWPHFCGHLLRTPVVERHPELARQVRFQLSRAMMQQDGEEEEERERQQREREQREQRERLRQQKLIEDNWRQQQEQQQQQEPAPAVRCSSGRIKSRRRRRECGSRTWASAGRTSWMQTVVADPKIPWQKSTSIGLPEKWRTASTRDRLERRSARIR